MCELEQTIAALITRKNAATPGSAPYRMAVRQLTGLHRTNEAAGPIIEELDPLEWGGVHYGLRD
jgi:hypothetical protein